LSLFTRDVILYVENPKDSTKKPCRTNKFSKVAEYKVSTHKISYVLYLTMHSPKVKSRNNLV